MRVNSNPGWLAALLTCTPKHKRQPCSLTRAHALKSCLTAGPGTAHRHTEKQAKEREPACGQELEGRGQVYAQVGCRTVIPLLPQLIP
ncbi:hypothetical protein HaLaN_29324 [Haematococcus lacustris]|uniref:Uncharacterized protein n=1 Tax=Haematococcus lacustris TaxID=44745 RepID=A0A6A0ACZ8_HAELA|nr:hypothetical protein HaLaN_29324 [Haematococcus lacustris]